MDNQQLSRPQAELIRVVEAKTAWLWLPGPPAQQLVDRYEHLSPEIRLTSRKMQPSPPGPYLPYFLPLASIPHYLGGPAVIPSALSYSNPGFPTLTLSPSSVGTVSASQSLHLSETQVSSSIG